MKKLIPFLIVISVLVLSTAEKTFPQEEPGLFITNSQFKGNNSEDPNDVSGMPESRVITPEEINLMTEIQRIKQADDPFQINRLLELESQLEALNPNSVSKPGEYYGGTIGQPYDNNNSFSPEDIGNIEIYNSGSSLISAIATATEQRGTTAGRIWTALAWSTTASRDTIRLYYSDDGGVNWTWYGWGSLGGTDRLNRDQMDMEIIENTTGEKYIWIVYGYRQDAGTGRWRTGGLIFQTPTFGGGFFALSWPGDDATKRYYRLRITSDNAKWATIPYVYMVASFDSLAGSIHINTQKTVRCTGPFTVSPTFSYKADKFNWWSSSTDGNQRDLHSDIAFFDNGGDSILVSFSNVPDSTKLFFAKSNNSNGPATSNGAGGFIGGSQSNDHKQFARLSSNGNDNGSIICVFRQNTSPTWRIKYFRTTNYGNFNSMNQSALQGSVTSNSFQPDIVGVRNSPKHYFAWRLNGTPDSLRYIGTTSLGLWPQNVGMMNSHTVISGVQGPKPGFRYVNDDSCFAIYSPTGPFDVWAALGCSGPPVPGIAPVLVDPPNNATDVSINPTLTWEAVPGATAYHLKVYLNGTTLVVDEPNVTSTSQSVGPLDYSSMYTWEVAAKIDLVTGPFSAPFTFNTMADPTTNVTVSSPNGGEVWTQGTTHNITWTSIAVTNVMIELSINNGASWSTVIASTPSSGIYSWLVPNTPSTQCLIRISDVSNPAINDVSDNVFTIDIGVGVEDEFSGIPDDYALLQNYPNPFNPNTTIYYGLPEESLVELKIYDILGNEIMKYSQEQQAAGYHKVNFDASELPSGTYIYQVKAVGTDKTFIETKKMILMK